MRYRKFVLTAAMTGLVAVGLVAPSQATFTTLCDGVGADVTVPGDLVVPAGKDCELTNVTITGNATVRADANLLLDESSIGGNLRVLDNGYADLIGDSTVTGNTQLATAYGAFFEDSSVGGNVNASTTGFVYSIGSSHGRSITTTESETFLETGRVSNHLTTTGSLLTDVYDTVIGGNVSVADALDGSVFCLSEVDGNASFSGNGGILQIGAQTPLSGCGFNVFGGDLSVTDNTSESFVADNVIRGDLVCSGNDPLPVVEGNRLRGADECESAEAALSRFGTSGAAEDRKAEVKAAIEVRSTEAAKSAEDAGPAFQ